MATVGAPPLKVTMKADPSSLEHPTAKRPSASAPWFDEGWVRQFKDLAPNPVPVDRATLLELRGAAPPAAAPAALAEATARALKPVHTQDDHLDEAERAFRDDLASFLKFRSRHELYSPIFLGVPLPMRKVFKKVRAMGGYRAVCDSKLWMRVCREAAGGKDLSGQTSASFAMRRNYEKTGMLEWEQTLDGTSLGGGAVANAGVPIDPDFGKTFVPVANGEIVPTGTRVRVLWNEENGESAWYGASTRGFDEASGKHHVAYDDETEETIDFGEEKVEKATEED